MSFDSSHNAPVESEETISRELARDSSIYITDNDIKEVRRFE